MCAPLRIKNIIAESGSPLLVKRGVVVSRNIITLKISQIPDISKLFTNQGICGLLWNNNKNYV